jgi:dihydrolipoamide dehydrogenase
VEQYDLLVIGGGPGGYVAAIRAAQYGLKTALVEEGQLGGTCLNRGCIPTKTLLHTAQLYRELAEGEGIGIQADALRYDLDALYRHKDEVVSELCNGVAALLQANGVTTYRGKGLLTGNHQVRVTGDEVWDLEVKHVILATGATPAKLKIPGIDLPGVVTSEELLTGKPLDCKRLVVIGGGVIGAEVASIYGNLGCEVTIVEAADRMLFGIDLEIAQNLSMILKKRGIEIHTGSQVTEIKESEHGLSICFEGKKGTQTVEAEAVLVSIGRKPNTNAVLAEGVQLETNKGFVVNDRFETSTPNIYAIGDCADGSPMLAHVASAQAKNVVAQIAKREAEVDLTLVPSCVYTDPEIAWVGMTAEQAKKQGKAVKTSKYSMAGNGKTLIKRQDRGFVKLVFEAETERLLGAQLMCGRATDLIGELITAIHLKATAKELSSVMKPHPTFGEGIGEAVEVLFEEAIHVMPKRK